MRLNKSNDVAQVVVSELLANLREAQLVRIYNDYCENQNSMGEIIEPYGDYAEEWWNGHYSNVYESAMAVAYSKHISGADEWIKLDGYGVPYTIADLLEEIDVDDLARWLLSDTDILETELSESDIDELIEDGILVDDDLDEWEREVQADVEEAIADLVSDEMDEYRESLEDYKASYIY